MQQTSKDHPPPGGDLRQWDSRTVESPESRSAPGDARALWEEFAAELEASLEPLEQAARLPHNDPRRAEILYGLDVQDAIRMARRKRAVIVCDVGRPRVRSATRPRRQARPRARRRVGASSRTSSADPGEGGEPHLPSQLGLRLAPRRAVLVPAERVGA